MKVFSKFPRLLKHVARLENSNRNLQANNFNSTRSAFSQQSFHKSKIILSAKFVEMIRSFTFVTGNIEKLKEVRAIIGDSVVSKKIDLPGNFVVNIKNQDRSDTNN